MDMSLIADLLRLGSKFLDDAAELITNHQRRDELLKKNPR